MNWMFVVGHFDHFWLWCMQFLHWHTIICCDRMYWPGRKTSFFFWKESEVLCHALNVTMTSLSSIDFCLSPAHRSIQSARKCIIIVWLIADVYAKSKEKKKYTYNSTWFCNRKLQFLYPYFFFLCCCFWFFFASKLICESFKFLKKHTMGRPFGSIIQQFNELTEVEITQITKLIQLIIHLEGRFI